MKKLLYVIDDINYISGAYKVTEYQMKLLSREYEVSVFTLSKPNLDIEKELSMVKFIGQEVWSNTEILAMSSKNVIKNNNYSFRQKLIRLIFAVFVLINRESTFLNNYIDNIMYKKMNNFDIVCVISESSKLRSMVASLTYPKKIQWIHTDYELWSDFSDWTKRITANDELLYQKYDTIVNISEKNKVGFIKKLPSLKDKVVVIPNLLHVEEIINKSNEPLNIKLDKNTTNIVTVGRIDKEKAYDNILDISKYFIEEKINFRWYIVGNGPLMQHLKHRILVEKLHNNVYLCDFMKNPYPLIKKCDIFILLSKYEGVPVTINEALILGTPVIATMVGGIPEQLGYGMWGKLVNGNNEEINSLIKNLIIDKNWMNEQKLKLNHYKYNNENIIQEIKRIFN